MFGKDAGEPEADSNARSRGGGMRAPGEERRVAAWIGVAVVVAGDLTSSEDMTVAGRVEGDVTVRDHILVVGPKATIRGDVLAKSVTIHGTVIGTITATHRLEVGETAHVEGDLHAPRLTLAEGARLKSRVVVASRSHKAAATP